MKRLLIIDGQGGGIGKMLIASLKRELPEAEITAVGTNAIATTAMIKAGASKSATGENSVVFLSKSAGVIAGPLGIIMANAMLGEVTPKMAEGVASSSAAKVLVPVSKCNTYVSMSGNCTLSAHIEDAVNKIKELLSEVENNA